MASGFSTSENTVTVANPSVYRGVDPIPVDISTLSESYIQYTPNSSTLTAGAAGVPSYLNNGGEIVWDVQIPSTSRVRLDKSFIAVTGVACKHSVSPATSMQTGFSIPWNTYAALIQRAELRLNQSQSVENIIQSFGDGNMAKMLTRYSRQALESMSETLFTPCIEATRDLCAADGTAPVLSTISAARRAAWLATATDNTGLPIEHTKSLMIGDIFDSARVDAAFYLQNLRISVILNDPHSILIGPRQAAVAAPDGPSWGDNGYFVKQVRLYLCIDALTQLEIEEQTKLIAANQPVFRQTFSAFSAKERPNSASASHIDPNVRNAQGLMMMIPSTYLTDGAGPTLGIHGMNRFQYVSGLVSSWYARYDGINSPNFPMNLDITNPKNNSLLFSLYRAFCTKMLDRRDTPALDALAMMLPPAASIEQSPYVLYCTQFFSDVAALHRTLAGSNMEVITGGGPACNVVLVYQRQSFMAIRGNTSVEVLE